MLLNGYVFFLYLFLLALLHMILLKNVCLCALRCGFHMYNDGDVFIVSVWLGGGGRGECKNVIKPRV